MLKLKIQFFAESDGGISAGADPGAAGDTAPGGADGVSGAETAGAESKPQSNAAESVEELKARIARMEADAAKNKSALDKATREAGDLRKELRTKMTQEQIDAAEKQEAAERAAQELDDLRKQVAKGNTVKTVMGKLGLSEEAAGNLADHLYGAADIDNALLEIQKAWQAREKALKLEYGKITAPGAGADSNSPEAQAVKRAAELGKTKNAINEQAQKAMSAYMR